MSEDAYLYLLIHREHPRFKIGVSRDPEVRVYALDQPIDPLRSVKFRFPAGEERGAERTLHFLFRRHNLEAEFHAGYREWFDIAALGEVESFMRKERARIGWLDVAPLGPVRIRTGKPAIVRAPTAPFQPTIGRRPERRPSNYVLGQRRRFAREAAERLARQQHP